MNSQSYENWKRRVALYRVKTCCFLVPLRTGLMYLAYLNIILSVVLIVGTATDTFSVLVQAVQFHLFEDSSKSLSVLAPTTELGFNVILVCGLHRNDLGLLRFYLYYGLVAIVTSILLYAIVIITIPITIILGIVLSILYQAYMIILVRSIMVEILQNTKNESGTVPCETADIKEVDKHDAENPDDPEIDAKTDPSVVIETVNEISNAPTEPENEKNTKIQKKTKDKEAAKKIKKEKSSKTKDKTDVETKTNEDKITGKKSKKTEKSSKIKDDTKETKEKITKTITETIPDNETKVTHTNNGESSTTVNTVADVTVEVKEGVISKFSTTRPPIWRGNITSATLSTPTTASIPEEDVTKNPAVEVIEVIEPEETVKSDSKDKKEKVIEKAVSKKRGWFRREK